MRIIRSTVVVSAVVALAVGGLAGCNDDSEKSNASKDAKALAGDALDLLRKADDVRVIGGGDNEGKKQDVDLCLRGADSQGTMKIDGSAVDVIEIGPVMYMKGNAAFWIKTMPPAPNANAMGKLIEGKYVKISYDDDPESGPGSTLGSLFEGSPDGVSKGEVVTIDGKKLIPLSKTNKSGNLVTVHVPERGRPFPTLVKVTGKTNLTMKFSRSGKKCTPAVPPADQVIDPATLDGETPAAPAAPTPA
ncbi:hypothetical protein [Embleya sp. AB8]|uniref:hypothetical protein n=1 Tax=Embleya sp. AB8 TaxID=3156304 RepID=UPI003C731C60